MNTFERNIPHDFAIHEMVHEPFLKLFDKHNVCYTATIPAVGKTSGIIFSDYEITFILGEDLVYIYLVEPNVMPVPPELITINTTTFEHSRTGL